MPSGKVHDLITFALAGPAGAAAYYASGEVSSAAMATGAFLFGGLMFGPDLDTVSRQYSRWSVLKIVWWPYRKCFLHRSRFTHGLLLGALFRVVYFLGVITLSAFAVSAMLASFSGRSAPGSELVMDSWSRVWAAARKMLGATFYVPMFLGLWFGAASHTFTDMAVSYIKTGRAAKFL